MEDHLQECDRDGPLKTVWYIRKKFLKRIFDWLI